jgi:deazaflavin-dependent oxidoreductase (nitroreductase family)
MYPVTVLKKEVDMSQTTSQAQPMPPILNKTMKFILRSPLHGMVSKTILLISFTGRKSGKAYATPVSYSQHDGQVYIFTHARWWKNLQSGTQVTLRIRGQDMRGLAEQPIVEDKQAVAAGLAEHLRQVPFDARFYHVALDDQGNPRPEDVAKAAETTVMIRVQLC